MRMNWITKACVAIGGLVALAACGSSTTTGTTGGAGGSETTTSETTTSETTTSSDTFTGSDTCAGLIAAWPTTALEGSSFSSEAAFNAYTALNTCACQTTNGMTPPGCSNICTQPQNGTTTNNFCNGVPALMQCTMCIMMSCATEYSTCMSN